MVSTDEMYVTLGVGDKHMDVLSPADHPGIVIVRARTDYIPHENFQLVFDRISALYEGKLLNKVIFDKRSLTVFNRQSMEWYFTVWKEKMYDAGLQIHRKILPDDEIFIQSVRIARRKLDIDYPDARYHLMDIRYSGSLVEAIGQ